MRKINPPSKDWKYGGFEELVLDLGVSSEAIPLPNDIELGQPKNCYFNCREIIKERSDLIYCEGFALVQDLPLAFSHAWLLDSQGKAIDPTWETPGIEYMGVPFNNQWAIDFIEQRKYPEEYLSVFEGNFLEKYSLLKEGLSESAHKIKE
ncbi:MAG: hypothetical protein QNJ38_14035 [Prochloraceae cyanobacterium]|nr:hypothetical protein [Prochloraceae cyanobacterium]